MDQSIGVANRQFNVGPRFSEDFETGALLHAVLAWPDASEGEQTIRTACMALCAGTIALILEADPSQREKLAADFPDYVAMDKKERQRQEMLLRKQLRRRMIAARMSLGFFAEGLSKQNIKLPPSMTRLSIDQLAKLVRSDTYIDNPQNIEKLIWRKSLPVLHLAVAFHVVGMQRHPNAVGIYPNIDDIEFYRDVVNLATVHEQVMLADPRFGKRRHELIRIRWVD